MAGRLNYSEVRSPLWEAQPRWSSQFHGYTYPRLFDHPWVQRLWKRLFCRRGWHLWDEVESLEDHYLYCDACEISFRGRES